MKQFVNPEIEVVAFEVEDVITVSGGGIGTSTQCLPEQEL